MDFKNLKISCSQIGGLMGRPYGIKQLTASEMNKLLNIIGRDYGELSEAMKHTAREIMRKVVYYEPRKPSKKILSELIMNYCYEMYGKTRISRGNDQLLQTEKGTLAEPESIKLLSKIDGVQYWKNDEYFENKWFKGHPDIVIDSEGGKIEKIIEIKTSYDLPSFIMSMYLPESSDNIFEAMGYMDLTGCRNAEIVHCLVDMPDQIMAHEERRLKERYSMLQLDEDHISNRVERVLNNMAYSEIPDELKVFRRPVSYNPLTMKEAKRRVGYARKWMNHIHEVFIKNLIILPENYEEDQEDSI